MAVVKRKTSKFYYVVIYSKGKQIWVNTRTTDKMLAQQIELDYKRVIQSKNDKNKIIDIVEKLTGQIIENVGLRLSNCWDCFLKQPGANTKESTLKTKGNQFKHFLDWITEESKGNIEYIHEITGDIAYRYTTILREEKNARTFNHYKNNISNVFQNLLAVPEANLKENVFKRIVAAKVGKTRSYRAFTDDEMLNLEEHLKANYKDNWYLLFMISKFTGLRLKDCVFLKSEYLNWEHNVIELVPEKGSRFGKILQIPIHKELAKILKPLRPSKDDYLMKNLTNQYASGFFNNKFGDVLKKLDIKETKQGNVGFHSLRHTFNTTLERAGISQAVRRKITGHRDDRINDIYSHAIEPVKEAINMIK